MGMVKQRIIVHTVYFPSVEAGDDTERNGARELGEQLYDLLTRPRIDPLGWGAGVPVRVATRFDQVENRSACRDGRRPLNHGDRWKFGKYLSRR